MARAKKGEDAARLRYSSRLGEGEGEASAINGNSSLFSERQQRGTKYLKKEGCRQPEKWAEALSQ